MAIHLGSSGVKSDINVTPFVDIVLVLLIIFMVVTPLLSYQLKLLMPAENPGPPAPVPEQVVVTVKGPASALRIFLNQEEIAGGIGSMKARIEELMKGRKDQDRVVFFQAEGDLPYEVVLGVMDALRGAGSGIGLITGEMLDPVELTGGSMRL